MNARIKYKPVIAGEAVILDGKTVGTIRAVTGGYAYFPKGSGRKTENGETFPTIKEVKQSIEAE